MKNFYKCITALFFILASAWIFTIWPCHLFYAADEIDPFKRGEVYLNNREFDKAISEFSVVIRGNPSDSRAYFNRGFAYFNKGMLKRALEDISKAIDLDPASADAYNARGVILISQGIFFRAIKDCEKAIELAPGNPHAYNNRAVAYRGVGRLDLSLVDLDKAISLNPSYGVAYRNRAITYYMKRNFDLCEADIEKARALGIVIPEDFMNALNKAKGMRHLIMAADRIKGMWVNKKGGSMAMGFILVMGIIMLFFAGIRIVRPTHRALIERLGKYARFAEPGFHWVIPVIDRMYQVNVTEQMVDAEPQEIITNDNLNARVDAQVYFRVKSDEESVKSSQYNVNNYQFQIVNLARTTLRNIIGTLTLKSANSERGKINAELHKTLCDETKSWGLDIVRTELKEIDPPKDVQETMNKVVKAENEKIAAVDFATATETAADGARRAEIKRAEGIKQAKILAAQGEAEAIKLVNEAAEEYFVGNAQVLRKLEAVENSLKSNAKIVVPTNTELVNVIGEMAGVLPLKDKSKE